MIVEDGRGYKNRYLLHVVRCFYLYLYINGEDGEDISGVTYFFCQSVITQFLILPALVGNASNKKGRRRSSSLSRSAPASGLHRIPIGSALAKKKITPFLHDLRPRFEHIRTQVRTPQLFPLMVKRRLHQFPVFQFVATPRA